MKNRLGIGWWIAIGVQMLLVIGAVWVVVPIVMDRTLAEQMADPAWLQRNRNAARQLLPYLQVTLQIAAAAAVAIPILCTICWFLYIWMKRVEAPGEARHAFRYWFLLGAIGMTVCFGFGAALLWSSHLQVAIDPDLSEVFERIRPVARLQVITAMVAYFWVSYYLIGTLFTTPALFRTAVPLASLRRSR